MCKILNRKKHSWRDVGYWRCILDTALDVNEWVIRWLPWLPEMSESNYHIATEFGTHRILCVVCSNNWDKYGLCEVRTETQESARNRAYNVT
jgi:hypothetical protein